MNFGVKHMTIPLETECRDPDDIHCDLRKLTGHHPETQPSRTVVKYSWSLQLSFRTIPPHGLHNLFPAT